MRKFATLVLLTSLSSCMVYARGGVAVEPATVQTTVVAAPSTTVVAAPTATAVATPVAAQPVCPSTCTQGAAEVCNGCDDNCNGVVDEGC